MENMDQKQALVSNETLSNSDNLQTSEVIEQTGQQASQPQEQEDWNYEKDSRWGKMWKDPKDVYKSYRNLEKEYETIKPIKSEYETIKKTFQENGLPMEQLNDYINQYKQYADPKNPRNMIADYFSDYIFNKPDTKPYLENFFEFVDKPEYRPALDSFFNNLVATENQKKYPGWNSEQIAKHEALQSEVNQFKELFQKQQFEQQKQEASKELEVKFQEIEKYGSDRGLTVTEEMKNNIAKYCVENGYNVRQVKAVFIELYGQDMENSQLKRHEENLMNKLNKNNRNVVPTATTSNSTGSYPKDGKLRDKYNAIKNQLGF